MARVSCNYAFVMACLIYIHPLRLHEGMSHLVHSCIPCMGKNAWQRVKAQVFELILATPPPPPRLGYLSVHDVPGLVQGTGEEKCGP